MKQAISEILGTIDKIKDKNERQAALASCAPITQLVFLLQYMFHPAIEFDLPGPGVPAFQKADKINDYQGSLYAQWKKMPYFVKGNYPSMKLLKRQQIFMDMLHTLDPDDVDLVVAMKDKICPYNNITYDLVFSTFPGLLPPQGQEGVKKESMARPLDDSKMKPCPFGCDGGKLRHPMHLGRHMKSKHPAGQ